MPSSIKTLLANAAYRFWGGEHYVHSLLRLFRLIFQNWGYLALGVVCMVGYNLFTAAPAWYIKNVVDALEKEFETDKRIRLDKLGSKSGIITTIKKLFGK